MSKLNGTGLIAAGGLLLVIGLVLRWELIDWSRESPAALIDAVGFMFIAGGVVSCSSRAGSWLGSWGLLACYLVGEAARVLIDRAPHAFVRAVACHLKGFDGSEPSMPIAPGTLIGQN